MARPRSAEAHARVLEQAGRLFAERGIEATSMDAIARAAEVSKATLYKHWPDKDRLALEVLGYLAGLNEPEPALDSGDLRQALIAGLSHEPAPERAALRMRLMPHVVAYSVRHPVFGQAWRERVVERQRRLLTTLLQRGMAEGRLAAKLDLDLAIALLAGPLVYRHIVQGRKWGAAPERALVTQVVDAFLRAFGN